MFRIKKTYKTKKILEFKKLIKAQKSRVFSSSTYAIWLNLTWIYGQK